MKHLLLTIVCLIAWTTLPAQDMRQDTYCNPLNIDYTYMIYNSDRDISYRSGADPAVVEFRGEYYMFVTRLHGYWHSRDSFLGVAGLVPSQMENRNLTWEKSDQYDLGLDVDLFDYRLKLKMDYYYKYTSSLLWQIGRAHV